MSRVRPHQRRADNGHPAGGIVELDAADLPADVAAPSWLRELGLAAWLVVGLIVLVVALLWTLALAHAIVMPVLAAAVVAAVTGPLVRRLAQHMPRGAAAVLLLLGLVAIGVLLVVLIVAGVSSESAAISGHLSQAQDSLSGWLKDLGVDATGADNAAQDAGSSATTSVTSLLHGVAAGIEGLAGLAFFLAMTMLSLVFLLKDGPQIRGWLEGHVGVNRPLAHAITGRVLQSLRGYFVGVTLVAAFNAVVVGVGAVVLGVPLAGTIAVVTFVGAYIPYLGAWSAGAFTVLIALGGSGTEAAIAMAVLQLLANGVLQQIVQPLAYGAALGIHPLAVLIVTIAGGALFGAPGLILAAPLTSAVTRISADVAKARAAEAADPAGPPASPDVADAATMA
jgi:predicted PurR-regulated permease PerM